MEKILIITEILKEVCPDVTIKVNPIELKFSRAFQVKEFIDMCYKFNERVSEESSHESAALPIFDVSKSVCKHCGGSGELAGGLVGCHHCGNY